MSFTYLDSSVTDWTSLAEFAAILQKAPYAAHLFDVCRHPQVSLFCDNTDEQRHKADAPNKQNARCNQRSVWEVMRENDDFAGGV